jgi:hypothetical protein
MKCRYCFSEKKISTLGGLNEMKVCGVFPNNVDAKLASVKMDLVHCYNCGLIQLSETGILLTDQYGENYGYRSGLNKSMVNHLKLLAQYESSLANITSSSVVIEVGANDGTHLREFVKTGAELIAIDPTLDKWINYYDFKAKMVCDFFPSEKIQKYIGKTDLIVSHACFYDLPDVKRFISSVSQHLKYGGIWSFEQIYLPSLIKNNAFDSICDEHLEYYTLAFIKNALEEHDIYLESISFNEVNGGSIWVTARKGYTQAFKNAFDFLIDMEYLYIGATPAQLHRTFQDFFSRIEYLGQEMREILAARKELGPVYAVGASTKGNALIQHWKLSPFIDACIEINPSKFNCYTPGSNIPIIEESLIDIEKSTIIIMPWHFGDSIAKKYKEKCKCVILPLPKITLIQ